MSVFNFEEPIVKPLSPTPEPQVVVQKKRGRPKGSKNRKSKSPVSQATEQGSKSPVSTLAQAQRTRWDLDDSLEVAKAVGIYGTSWNRVILHLHSKHRREDLDENSVRDFNRVSAHYDELKKDTHKIWKDEPNPKYSPSEEEKAIIDMMSENEKERYILAKEQEIAAPVNVINSTRVAIRNAILENSRAQHLYVKFF